jgi:dTDP-4-amino-4,6-dideoxygalactose transaminase
MTEIEAAIGVAQLKKLKPILEIRESEIRYLETRLSKLPGLILPYVDQNNTHVYYTYGMRIDPKIIKNTKHEIVEKLTKKGVPNLAKTFPNLHLLPIFQQKIAFGNKGFPWTLPGVRREISYNKGICPVSENLVDNTFFQFYINEFNLSLENLDFIASSFEEVWLTLDFKQ